jgi:undecaprenyl diphosphate synthase
MLGFTSKEKDKSDEGIPEGAVDLTPPEHIAIIMDGNGRWATKRGLPRIAGHKRGLNSVRKVTREAKALGVKYLTLFAFSTENWLRPREEVHGLMDLFRFYMRRECKTLVAEGVRIRFIGDPSEMPEDIQQLMVEAEDLTSDGDEMTLVVALNYGSRAEIVRAAARLADRVAAGEITSADVTEEAISAELTTSGIPDPDLILRTSGEQRLSNFLLWQAAYTEFLFIDKHWPDFDQTSLQQAIIAYNNRDRRFGAIEKTA